MLFLPMPHAVRMGEGVFALRHDTRITLADTEPSALLYAQMLRDDIRAFAGLDLPLSRGVPQKGEVVLRMDGALAADVYTLTVTPEGVTVRGGSDESVLHGVTTLCQWVRRHGARLPAIEVEDKPDLARRGYYLDCSRGRVPTLDTLKRYADLLCRYKINEWQLYVEHTYLFKGLSEAWREDTPLTAEEIMELDRYCQQRHIELVPSLSSFGHMYQILSTKTCADLCELPDSEKQPFSYTYWGEHHTLNVSNPRTMDFIEGLITEYMALFTSRKFNICCDETYDLGKGRSKALADEKGTQTLYVAHVRELLNFLLDKGVTPMFWGDIMWRHPETYKDIPQGAICLNWGYLPDQREDEIRALAEMGATQYACPGVCTWNKWFPMVEDSYKNNRAMCAHGRKYGAIGLLNTDWGDYGHVCHPWLAVPGILYGAAFAWNADGASFEEVNQAISLLEYGDREGKFMEGFAALSGHEVFGWHRIVRWIETRDEARRRELMAEVDVSRVPKANAAVDAALEQLAAAALRMDASQRSLMHAISIAAHGIKLWNRIAQWVTDRKDGDLLASELEAWYHDSMDLWRAVSKEGAAVRNTKIITAWADALRGREN